MWTPLALTGSFRERVRGIAHLVRVMSGQAGPCPNWGAPGVHNPREDLFYFWMYMSREMVVEYVARHVAKMSRKCVFVTSTPRFNCVCPFFWFVVANVTGIPPCPARLLNPGIPGQRSRTSLGGAPLRLKEMREIKPDSEFDEDTSVRALVERWRLLAYQYLADTPPEDRKVIMQYYWKSAYDFLCALHSALAGFIDKGLEAFRCVADPELSGRPMPLAGTIRQAAMSFRWQSTRDQWVGAPDSSCSCPSA